MTAHASAEIDTTQLAFATAIAIAEAPFVELENQSRELAAMAACGFITKQDAVDIAYTASLAAIGGGTWYRHDPDSIQEIIAKGFEMEESKAKPAEPRAYHTPESTIDAFWYVVRNENDEYLARWLAEHPLDAPYLRKLAEERCTSQ
jgi:hypothetical protein